MDLEKLIRDVDPARNILIPEADPADARNMCVESQMRLGAMIGVALSFLAISATVGVAVIAFTVVGHGRRQPSVAQPSLSAIVSRSVTPPSELKYLGAALAATSKRDHTCRPFAAGGTISDGSPSRALLSILGVLRHPATQQDKLPKYFSNAGRRFTSAAGIYVNYIRLARVEGGVAYYVVPAAEAELPPIPAHCYAEEVTALHNELPHIPKALRASTLQQLAQMQRNTGRQTIHEGIGFVNWRGGSGGETWGATATQIEQGGILGTDGPIISGVVPDGVATVTFYYSAGSNGPGRKRSPALTVTTKVANNVFAVQVARANGGNTGQRIVWRSGKGAIIRTITVNRR